MDIDITDEGFKPNNIIAKPPELIVWHNKDDKTHTVTSTDGHSFDSPDIAPGQSYQVNFRDKGIYGYYDRLNKSIQGEISISNIPPST